MSTTEKADIMADIDKLPEKDQSFILGYAAGVLAKSAQCNQKECA